MAAQAWPYAIARGKLVGFQAIVVPDFLADENEAYLLEYASRAEADTEPGELIVRAVDGSVTGPVTIAYRIAEATAERYGLEGGGPLRDRSGRDIRVFEGLVLRLPARRAEGVRIIEADMDGVTARIAPAFRRLWMAADAIEADRSTEISLGSAWPGAPALSSSLVQPETRSRERTRVVAAVIAVLVVIGLSFAIWSLAAPHPVTPKTRATPAASASAKAKVHRRNARHSTASNPKVRDARSPRSVNRSAASGHLLQLGAPTESYALVPSVSVTQRNRAEVAG